MKLGCLPTPPPPQPHQVLWDGGDYLVVCLIG